MIVGLAGKAQSGKSTVAKILVEDHGFEEIPFAESLKGVALAIDPIVYRGGARLSEAVESQGWDTAKKDSEVRRTLQRLGVAIREQDPDFWVNVVERKMKASPGVDFVIPDVRFPNEVEAIDRWGGILYRVERPGAGSVAGTENHVSETALDHIEFFNVLKNESDIGHLRTLVGGWFA